jgi:HEAT repeat protein
VLAVELRAENSSGAKKFAAGHDDSPKQSPADTVRRDQLRFEGGTFEVWRQSARSSLEPALIVNCLRAVAVLGANGYESEATAVVLDKVHSFGYHPFDKEDAKVLEAAEGALRKIGPAAVPALGAELKSERELVRRFAAKTLSGLLCEDRSLMTLKSGPETVTIVTSLLNGIGEPNEASNRHADYLRKVTIDSDIYTAVLAGALSDSDPFAPVRSNFALSELSRLGPKAKGAVPALIKQLNSAQRNQVVIALASIGPEAKGALPDLEAMLAPPGTKFDPDQFQFQRTLRVALKKIDPRKYANLHENPFAM